MLKKGFLSLIILFLLALTPSLSFAQIDDEINADPLYSDDVVSYLPIPKKDIEVEKIRSLRENDIRTMHTIGLMYRDGTNVDADISQALEWFKNAANAGNSDAMVELARVYALDKQFTGMERNEFESKRWILEAEKRNNPKALYTIGLMYEEGFPFTASYETAFEYFRKAAAKGILNAYVKLYIAYQYGKGTDPNLKRAIYWLRKIKSEAKDGAIKEYAERMLNQIYFELALKEENTQIKFRLFNLSWANGNRYAIEAIGDMFQAGVGVKKSYTSALVAYDTAIKKYESIYAMERSAFIYLRGPEEIDKDYTKAFELFKKAAELGGVEASYMIGYMNFYGLGVARNPQEANIWFTRSQQLASRRNSIAQASTSSISQAKEALKDIFTDVENKEKEIDKQEALENIAAQDQQIPAPPPMNIPLY
jgi:TPR repeat protein